MDQMKLKNKHHIKLLKLLKEEAERKPFKSKLGTKYEGHSDISLPLSSPQIRKIAKEWSKDNKELTQKQLIRLLNSLYANGKTSTEKYLGGYLLSNYPELRKTINPKQVEVWLSNLEGWAQIDSLCAGNFSSSDFGHGWKLWVKELEELNKSRNINKRRASLVLLIKPITDTKYKKFIKLAFKNIDNLKSEKDTLITKAISWVLRSMVKNHKKEVKAYLNENKDTLPAVAVRETIKKIKTGKK